MEKQRRNLPGRQVRQWRHPAPRPLPLTADSPRGRRWYPEFHSRSRNPASHRSSHPGRSARLRAPSGGPGARLCGPPPRGPAGLRGSVSGRIPVHAALPEAADGSLQPPGDWWTHRPRSRQERQRRSPGGAKRLEGAARGRRRHGVQRTQWMPSRGEVGHQTQTLLVKFSAAEHCSSLRSELHSLSCQSLWWLVPLVSACQGTGRVYCTRYRTMKSETQAISFCDNSFNICFACFSYEAPLASFCAG